MIWGEGRNEVQIDPLLPPTYIFFAPQLTPYNILQNLTTNWVGVRLPPTYIFGDPLLTPTYIFNFIPTPPPDEKWNSPKGEPLIHKLQANRLNQIMRLTAS